MYSGALYPVKDKTPKTKNSNIKNGINNHIINKNNPPKNNSKIDNRPIIITIDLTKNPTIRISVLTIKALKKDSISRPPFDSSVNLSNGDSNV